MKGLGGEVREEGLDLEMLLCWFEKFFMIRFNFIIKMVMILNCIKNEGCIYLCYF